jgi:predicted nucleotidyltransferase
MLAFRRDEIYTLSRQYGVTRIRVFGSVSRKQETETSDINLLIDVDADHSLLDIALFSNDLEDILGRKVDLMTEPALHPLFKTQILVEASLL